MRRGWCTVEGAKYGVEWEDAYTLLIKIKQIGRRGEGGTWNYNKSNEQLANCARVILKALRYSFTVIVVLLRRSYPIHNKVVGGRAESVVVEARWREWRDKKGVSAILMVLLDPGTHIWATLATNRRSLERLLTIPRLWGLVCSPHPHDHHPCDERTTYVTY